MPKMRLEVIATGNDIMPIIEKAAKEYGLYSEIQAHIKVMIEKVCEESGVALEPTMHEKHDTWIFLFDAPQHDLGDNKFANGWILAFCVRPGIGKEDNESYTQQLFLFINAVKQIVSFEEMNEDGEEDE
jgi:hypothetical protein